MADATTEVLSGLQRARDEQAMVVEREYVKLARLDAAIATMNGKTDVTVNRRDYAGLGIVAAAERYLREVGTPQTTKDIAATLLSRGLQTRSKRFVPNVYATLANSSQFKRGNGKWALTSKVGAK